MACTYLQHDQAMKIYMGPAYLGVGLPNAYSQNYFQNFNNGYPTFRAFQWNGYTANGCIWWVQRINHWTNQLNNNTYNPYQTQLKQAKIAFATYMHGICGCTVPLPAVANVGTFTLVSSEEDKNKVSELIDDSNIEYDKLDKQ